MSTGSVGTATTGAWTAGAGCGFGGSTRSGSTGRGGGSMGSGGRGGSGLGGGRRPADPRNGAWRPFDQLDQRLPLRSRRWRRHLQAASATTATGAQRHHVDELLWGRIALSVTSVRVTSINPRDVTNRRAMTPSACSDPDARSPTPPRRFRCVRSEMGARSSMIRRRPRQEPAPEGWHQPSRHTPETTARTRPPARRAPRRPRFGPLRRSHPLRKRRGEVSRCRSRAWNPLIRVLGTSPLNFTHGAS